MRNAGNNNLGEFIRDLPQNFNGGQSPAVGSGAGTSSNPNSAYTLNLRGIGRDATLTLLNGRRLAYNSVNQGVDISAIPIAAIDRVEIVADGASALYGSDAVGGVANIVLKREYDGVSASARFGASTSGGNEQQQYGVVGGQAWSSGGVIATFNYETSTPILARQRAYTINQSRFQQLYPPIENIGGVFSGHQEVADIFRFGLDAVINRRNTYTSTSLNVNDPPQRNGSESYIDNDMFTIVPSIGIDLPAGWRANLNFVYGSDVTIQTGGSYSNGTRTPSGPTRYSNRTQIYEAYAEGPLAKLPAGDARLAIGGGYREVRLYSGRSTPPIRAKIHARYAYGELYAPLLGKGDAVAPVLSATAAVRYEDYSTEGGVAVPKIGLILSPVGGIKLSGSWGKSFKTPVLNNQYFAQQAVLFAPSTFAATGFPAGSTIIYRSGGNPDVISERAENRSVTADISPAALPGMNISLSYYKIKYLDRVVTPIASVVGALSNTNYKDLIVLNPTLAQINAAIADASTPLSNFAGVPYDPSKVVAIVDARYQNAARQRIEGVDVAGSYRIEAGSAGTITLNLAGTYLLSHQQLIAGAAETELSGIIFNPPKVRGRAGIVWQIDRFSLAPQAIYSGPLTDNRLATHVRIPGQVTFNVTARYTIATGALGFKGLDLSASMMNIANTDPAKIAVTTVYNAPYESTNYNPIGRFLSFSITGRW